MAWVYLMLAGLFEVGWAIALKYTEGFTRLLPTAWTLGCLIASLWLLALALRTLPVGTAYAIWTGIGAAGTAVLGMILFDEPRTVARVLSLLFIMAGMVGLKLATPEA